MSDTPVIDIERIEIVLPLQGRPGCVMAQRVITVDGETRSISPVNLLVGDIDATGLPQAVQDAIASINSQLQSQVTQLQADLTAANTAKDQAIQAKQQAEANLATANARIAELEAQLNPPNPFPNADWQGFRSAALSDPAVQRVAAGNPVLWPVLFLYLSELSTNPARGRDIAWLWNNMEANTPVTAEEIARINGIATSNGVPLQMNAEGQIVVP